MGSLVRILRNNWKKTIFFGIVGYVGTKKVNEKYWTFQMMKTLSLEAQSYGKKPLPRNARTKHITILLNPVAGNRKGREDFAEYAEPLIHLSGFLVNVVKTEKISEARELVELIEKTNIIGVAGGDGTLMEVVTGLLRRDDAEEAVKRFPVSVIPVGTRNSFGNLIFKDAKSPKEVIAQAAMSISRHHIEPKDAIKVEVINDTIRSALNESQEEISSVKNSISKEIMDNPTEDEVPFKGPKKPYYVLNGLRLGRFCEAEKREDNMPRFLFKKFRTFWSLFRAPEVECKAELRYQLYCDGCLKCKDERLRRYETQQTFFHRLISIFRPSVHAEEHPKWKFINPNCGLWESICVDTTELNILSCGNGKLEIQVGKTFSTLEFLLEGLKRKYRKESEFGQKFICQEVEVFPIATQESYLIDNEEFPARPIRMKVLRDKVHFFTPSP